MSEGCCFTCGLLNRRLGTYYSQFSSSQLKNKFRYCLPINSAIRLKINVTEHVFLLMLCVLHDARNIFPVIEMILIFYTFEERDRESEYFLFD